MRILFGAYFDLFVNRPNLSIISVLGFCLSIFSRAYFQDA
jgi:hypothetical protein